MSIDPTALADSLRRLADRTDPTGLTTTLEEVADACVTLFGVTGSGIMVADEQNVTRYVAASDGPGRILEVAESETGQGPCTEAFVNNGTVGVADLSTDPRWRDLAAILAPYGVRAVLGAPIRLGGIPVGTIDVYRDQPHDWDESEHLALGRYAELVGITVGAALAAHQAKELAGQLQYALDYRVLIERGVGFLMARDRIDSVAAFQLLRRAARNTQAKIGDVAGILLETGRLPGERN